MNIIDNYKVNKQNQLSIDLNKRSIENHLRFLRFYVSDSGLLTIIGDVFKSIADNSKKYAVPDLIIVALFYSLNYVYQKWKNLEKKYNESSHQSKNVELKNIRDRVKLILEETSTN
jgi:hypothetical protein